MRVCLAVWLLFGVYLGTEGVGEGVAEGYNRRLSPDERNKAFNDMKNRYTRADPPCIPPTSPPQNVKPLPTVPESFTTKVEIAYEEENKMKVLYGAESYDGVYNMGVLRYELGEGVLLSRPYAYEEIVHYSVPSDLALFIYTDTACEETDDGNCDPYKSCYASDLEHLSEQMKELFGYGDANGDSGYYGAGGILQWGPQFNYEYKGMQECRGLRCERWEACEYNEEDDATLHLVYHWSDTNWTVASNGDQVPISIEVFATGKFGHFVNRHIVQRYDFYEFYRDIRPDMDRLQPPADVYCVGRESVYQPPRVPRYFSYNTEAVTGFDFYYPIGENETQRVQFTTVFTNQEIYDWDSKIVVTDYVPWFIIGQEYRYEYETRRIQDFNQGLTYHQLIHKDTCSVHRIENITSAGDVVVDDNGTVTLLPPWIFENLDDPMQYNGLHTVRGVDADTWIGRNSIFGSKLFFENIVWYYASPLVVDETKLEVKSSKENIRTARMNREMAGKERRMAGMDMWNVGLGGVLRDDSDPPVIVSMDKVPLRMEKYLNVLASLPHLVYNMYDYSVEPPLTHTFDISKCYTSDQMRHFTIELPDDTLIQIDELRDNLLYATQLAMAEVGVVSPLRINRIVLDTDNGKVKVLFTILDKPKVEGDAPGTDLESSMDEAVSLIKYAVDNSQLIIIIHLNELTLTPEEPKFVVLVAKHDSMVEVKRDGNHYSRTKSEQYNSGDMAGLAIGMLIMGTLMGVGVCYVIKTRSGNSSGLPRVKLAHASSKSASSDHAVNFNADMTASDI